MTDLVVFAKLENILSILRKAQREIVVLTKYMELCHHIDQDPDEKCPAFECDHCCSKCIKEAVCHE